MISASHIGEIDAFDPPLRLERMMRFSPDPAS
jgi:hypothetical protein